MHSELFWHTLIENLYYQLGIERIGSRYAVLSTLPQTSPLREVAGAGRCFIGEFVGIVGWSLRWWRSVAFCPAHLCWQVGRRWGLVWWIVRGFRFHFIVTFGSFHWMFQPAKPYFYNHQQTKISMYSAYNNLLFCFGDRTSIINDTFNIYYRWKRNSNSLGNRFFILLNNLFWCFKCTSLTYIYS